MNNRLIAFLFVFITSSTAVAGSFVEVRNAYNTVSETNELILRAGHIFDMGAGMMFTDAYNVGKWDEMKHSYNEIEGWYPLLKLKDRLTFKFGGILTDTTAGSIVSPYLDTNYVFTSWFNLTLRYRYNHSNYDSLDLNGKMNRNDTHDILNYWNFKLTDSILYTFEPRLFIHKNNFQSRNGKDHRWEISNKFSYRLDQHFLPYIELQWLDRWNTYHREQYRIRLGLRYWF
ncbi:porin OmpL [Salmonella enterica]|nr:porin OmpL [Salmonella enterica]EAX6581629.1 porin OmpL [Salmonella enterica]